MTEKELWLNSGIGEAYWNTSLQNFTGDQNAKKEVEKYLNHLHQMRENGIGLYLWGENGLGKTLLAIEVLKRAVRETNPKTRSKYSIYKTSLAELVTAMTKGWYDDATRLAFERIVIGRDFLLIDDIEKGYFSKEGGLQEAALDMVLRKRIERLRPVIITSNKEPKSLEMNFGKSIASLLAGFIYPIKFEGKDFRREKTSIVKFKELTGNV